MTTKRLDALVCNERDGKTFWTRIGVAFPHRETGDWNNGATIMLDALPVDGKIVLRPPKPRDGQRQAPQQRRDSYDDGGTNEPPPF